MLALTPLKHVPVFTDAIRSTLARYWITSAEEFISTARASNAQYGSGLAALAHVLSVPPAVARDLVAVAQNALPSHITFDVIPEQIFATGAIFEGMPASNDVSFELPLVDLPAEKDLTTGLPAPRAQGRRNTCVAFALTAMLQQMSGVAYDLSPQFAYWACKARDDIPGDSGTRPDIAMQALIEMGICQEQTWRYNPIPDYQNPGQGPPPIAAVEEARLCRAVASITLPPNDLLRIKATIAAGRSVLIGLPAQEHWTSTWQSLTLGRVRPPLPGERTRSGHAMLAVGYRDDPSAPGNGYLIVRNSWGSAWGKENPDGPGYGHIAYQVILEHNLVAFAITGVTQTWQSVPQEEGGELEQGVTLSAMQSAASMADMQALYHEAQQALATTLHNLEHLNALMQQLGHMLGQAFDGPELPATPSKHTVVAPQPVWQAAKGALVLLDNGTYAPHMAFSANGILATTGLPLLTIDITSASAIARLGAHARKTDDPEHALHEARVAFDQNRHFGMLLGGENNLEQAGWAIVVHADEEVALLQALSPLIVKRCHDQGFPAPLLEFYAGETCGEWLQRVVANVNAPLKNQIPVLIYYTGESASTWLARHGTSLGPVDPLRGVPFYLLLAGRPGPLHKRDTTYLPFAFQYELDIFWGVGRLCFTDPQTGLHTFSRYSDYAEQVVAVECATKQTKQQHITYFGTRHDLDLATQRSAAELIQPLYQGRSGAQNIAEKLGFTQDVFLAEHATRANLDRILSGQTPLGSPTLFFAATHGIGFPADDPRLFTQQGALVCQDWSGFGGIRREHWYAAEDLPVHTAVSGMIMVCFACYGVGCPAEDQFVFVPGQERPSIAPYSLIAQLPQQLLARGALAVLGHIDRAWIHSFSSPGAPAQTQSFESVLGRLMQGDRIGLATDQFNMLQGAIAARLANLLEKTKFKYQISDTELSMLWVARNDARNYVLLGDPAVRLV